MGVPSNVLVSEVIPSVGGGALPFVVQSVSAEVEAGATYVVSTPALTLTFPAEPEVGDRIAIFAAEATTVDPNGKTIAPSGGATTLDPIEVPQSRLITYQFFANSWVMTSDESTIAASEGTLIPAHLTASADALPGFSYILTAGPLTLTFPPEPSLARIRVVKAFVGDATIDGGAFDIVDPEAGTSAASVSADGWGEGSVAEWEFDPVLTVWRCVNANIIVAGPI